MVIVMSCIDQRLRYGPFVAAIGGIHMTETQTTKMPDPRLRNPLVFLNGAHDPATVFLSKVIDHPNIDVGDWTYCHD